MKQKKIPMRSCIITKEKYEKKDLIRIVRTPEGIVKIDTTGKMNGRGAYLKKDLEVIDKCEKMQALNRILETNVEKEIYDEFRKNRGKVDVLERKLEDDKFEVCCSKHCTKAKILSRNQDGRRAICPR